MTTEEMTAENKSERSVLREWHAFTPAQRKAEWTALVEWVMWLHDRYELATETRIPECWVSHPGLIEELFALKAWREEIYAVTQPSAQAARYWHVELRQVVQAAGSFYAKGCRAGHRGSGRLIAADDKVRAAWLEADPLTGIPPNLLNTQTSIAGEPLVDKGEPTVVTDMEMREAIACGDARPVGKLITDYQYFRGNWWLASTDGNTWQQVTDPIFAAELDAAAARMAIADSLVDERRHVTEALAHQGSETDDPIARQGDKRL